MRVINIKNEINFAEMVSKKKKEKKFIDIKELIRSKNPKLLRWLPGFVILYLKRILHQKELNYFLSNNIEKYNFDFCHAAIDYFNIKINFNGVENIPKQGSVVLAMNHPLGGMDGVAFISAIQKHRSDIKFIVNDLLMNIDNLKGLFVGVNKHGKNDQRTHDNIDDLFLSEQAVCIFPAGLVSRKVNGKVRDLMWKKTFVLLGKKYNRDVIPIHIDGKLSNFFYRLSNLRKKMGIKANIEMLYLADEMYKQKNKEMTFTIGKPISLNQLSQENPKLNDKQLAGLIYKKLYELEQ